MKTKNIIRTLLMAAFLLSGANNVKAGDIWEGSQNSGSIILTKEQLKDAKLGTKLEFYIGNTNQWYWQIDFKINDSVNPDFKDFPNDGKWGATWALQTRNDLIVDGHLDIVFGDNTADYISNYGSLTVNLNGIEITKITLVNEAEGPTYSVIVGETENGQISVAPETDVAAGTTVTITATPNEGYKISTITVTGADETNVEVSGSGNTRKFVMPEQNVTVSATFVEIETVEATIDSSTGFATFCSDKALDFTGINTLEAYYAKTVEDGNVYLLRVSGAIAAGTGLVIKGETTKIPVADNGEELSGNLMIGVATDTEVHASNIYVLTVKNDVAVFAQTGANAATVAAGHAYLRVPVAQARTRTIDIGGEGTTGIEHRFVDDNEQGEEVIYNLNGQRVKNPRKGLYIINGKKVLVK